MVCLNANSICDTGEFAILVRSDPMGHGLGSRSVSATAASYPFPFAFLAPLFFALGTVSAPHRT